MFIISIISLFYFIYKFYKYKYQYSIKNKSLTTFDESEKFVWCRETLLLFEPHCQLKPNDWNYIQNFKNELARKYDNSRYKNKCYKSRTDFKNYKRIKPLTTHSGAVELNNLIESTFDKANKLTKDSPETSN